MKNGTRTYIIKVVDSNRNSKGWWCLCPVIKKLNIPFILCYILRKTSILDDVSMKVMTHVFPETPYDNIKEADRGELYPWVPIPKP